MQTTLSPELEAFAKKQAQMFDPVRGAEDFVREAETLVKDEVTRKALYESWLLHLAEESEKRGGAIPAEQVFAEVYAMLDELDQQAHP